MLLTRPSGYAEDLRMIQIRGVLLRWLPSEAEYVCAFVRGVLVCVVPRRTGEHSGSPPFGGALSE